MVQLTYLILILSKCAVAFHRLLENRNLFQILGQTGSEIDGA